MKLTEYLLMSVMAIQLLGCAAATDNLDILNSTTIPVINSFASTPTYTAGSGFSTSNPYLTFSTTGFGSLLAPARGIIAEIGTSSIPGFTSTSYVTIIHSGRVATRIHGVQTSSVRAGDVIGEGAVVGTFFTTSSVALQVILDGASVCPLTFLSPAVRQLLFNNPCL